MLREARETVILPYCDKLIEALVELAQRYQNVPMMARTLVSLLHLPPWVKKWQTWLFA